VRLEGQHQAPAGEGAARGGQRRRHFDRVVAVVIDQREAAAGRQGHLAIALEAAADALEFGERLDDRGVGDLHLGGDGDGGQRIQDVVQPGRLSVIGRRVTEPLTRTQSKRIAAVCGDDVFGVRNCNSGSDRR
jgi:hypothetical protein